MYFEMPAKRVYITWLKYQLLAVCFFPGMGLYENALTKCVNKMEFYGIWSSGSSAGKDSVLLGRYALETSTRRKFLRDLNLE